MVQNYFKNLNKKILVEVIVAIAVVYLAWVVKEANAKKHWEFDNSDLIHEYNSALLVGSGQNPYSKILEGDLLINRKYATLFPLYYYLVNLVQIASDFRLEIFLDNFRTILFIAQIVAALYIYLFFRKENMKVVGLLAAAFFIFNRWSINVMSDAKQDFIAIAFLTVSLYYLKNKPVLAYLLYGFSLGVKHLGIFVLPIYLLPLFETKKITKDLLLRLSLIALPIVLPSIYFMLDNFKAFAYSMAFSFTRKTATTSTPSGYENLLILYDIGVKNNTVFFYILPRLPLVIFSLLNFFVLVTKRIRPSLYLLTSFFIFIAFNPVLFDQYLTWLTPILFVSFTDYLKPEKDAFFK